MYHCIEPSRMSAFMRQISQPVRHVNGKETKLKKEITVTLHFTKPIDRNSMKLVKLAELGVNTALPYHACCHMKFTALSRVGAVALYTVLWTVVVKYRKWPFSAPHRTKTP
jgi:hypothetical protein